MVYESDFYTTRRPYRPSPSLSTYTITSEPSRQVRLLPGLGKVHVVHTYDRIVPYVGHKRLHVVTTPPIAIRLRPSTLYREFDRIEHKYRPFTYNSYTNDYLNSNSSVRIVYVRNPISSSYPAYSSSTYTTKYYPSYQSSYYYPSCYNSYYNDYLKYNYPFSPTPRLYSYYNSYYPSYYNNYNYSYYPSDRWSDLALYPSWRYSRYARMFDDETRLIRAQSASLLQRIHDPVPRKYRAMPLPYVSRYDEVPSRIPSDNYIHRMLISSPSCKSEYTTYSSDPVRKYFGQGHLSCITLVGEKTHPRRRNVYMYDNPVKNDIQLLSYYITKMRDQKASSGKTATITVPKELEDTPTEELNLMKSERAARLAKIRMVEDEAPAKPSEDAKKKRTEREAANKAAEEKAKAEADASASKAKEDAAKKAALAKAKEEAKEEAARKAELAKQEELAAQAAAERAAEAERLAEKTRQDELVKQAEIDAAKKAEEELAKLEEEKRAAEAAKAEEEKQQLIRLAEIARQAEDDKEAELARQADELAELARQEAELVELARKEEEIAEQARKEADQADLEKKQAELAELEKQELELEELAKQENELADQARIDADNAQRDADVAELAAQETEQASDAPAEDEAATDDAQVEDVAAAEPQADEAVEEPTEDVNEE